MDSLSAEPQGKPKNTGVGSLSLLQGIFPIQGSNWVLLHCRWILYQLSYQGSPRGGHRDKGKGLQGLLLLLGPRFLRGPHSFCGEPRSFCGDPTPPVGMPLRPAGLLLSASGPSVHSLPPVLPRPLGHNQRGEGGHGRPWSLGLVVRMPALSSCSQACRAVCHLTRAILAAALGAVLDLLHFQGGSRGQEGALLEPGP